MNRNITSCNINRISIFLTILLLLTCILCAGCTITTISREARGSPVPPSYGLNDGRLVIHFIDVGQGDSELIQYNGKNILVDAGDAAAGPGLVSYLQRQGVYDIDLLVATHPHSDHIGGMQDIFKNFNVTRVIDAGMPHTTTTYRKFLETIDTKNIPYTTVKRGDLIRPDPDLTLLVLNAPGGGADQDLNEGSIVLLVSYGEMNVLLEGDAGNAGENSMLMSGLPLESQVLKVAHHGSPYGSGTEFIARVRPQAAVISCGADNPYNYPGKNTLERLNNSGALVFRTDTDGSIVIRSDGMKFSLETRREGLYPFITASHASVTG